MRIGPILVTPPAVLPVSVLEMRGHLRVDSTCDDEQIADLIREATAHLDGWTGVLGRCLAEQTWRQDYEEFASRLELPLGPVVSVTDVEYMDDGDQVEPVDPSDYTLRADAAGHWFVEFAAGASISGPVSVTFVAGYPTIAGASGVPADIKGAIVLYVRARYDPLRPDEQAASERAFDALIRKYRRIGL